MQKYLISIIANNSKNDGGANIAATRISKILKKKYRVNIIQPKRDFFLFFIKSVLSKILIRILIGKTKFLNSLNLFDAVDINTIKGKVLNIHWIGKNTISIKSLKKIDLPIIWTLHDMWPITSSEHFLTNPNCKNYTIKDVKNNFLKRRIFLSKKNLFEKKKIVLVACCKWLEKIAKKSEISKNVKITTIYNPIEIDLWKRKNNTFSKKILNLNIEKKYLLFGAQGGLSNPRKGGDLFIQSILKLRDFLIQQNYEIIILGGKKNYIEIQNGIKFYFRKHEKSIQRQVFYHSAADLTLSCSKAEALPQFLVETLLCKNPVVSFNVGGISEIISHKKNGYLAKPYNVTDFCKGIKYVIKNQNKLTLNEKINLLKKKFNQDIVLKKYDRLIRSII